MKQRALITGASAGLGAEFARQLAGQDKNLILVARRKGVLDELAQSLIDEFGIEVDVIPADLSQPNATSELFAEVTRRGLAVHYLINNAGAFGPDLLDDRDWSAQQRYLELMMISVAGMCHHFIPPMAERGFGRVLNVSSIAGHVSLAGDTNYGPSKAYLIALSKGLAATLRGRGVHVLALCPGFTHTDVHADEVLQKMKRGSPSFIWYDADVVVREGLQALEKGKAVYISGRLYRYLTPLLKTRFGIWLMRRTGVKRDY